MAAMIRRVARTILVTAVAVCVLVAAPMAAGRGAPFKGRIAGTFVATPSDVPAVLSSQAHAIGNATHLGAFTKVTNDLVNLATGEVTGTFTMTAANGDQLTGSYDGAFSFGSAPGTLSWVLPATITGGTGRFSDASGAFVFVADVRLELVGGMVLAAYTETFEGTIDY